MEEALNKQVNAELFSAYLYFSMASYFYSTDMNGFAHWMEIQVREESVHALKLFNYINDRDGRALMMPIEGPQTEWKSPMDVFQATLEHEQKVTGLINDLVNLAVEARYQDVRNDHRKLLAEWIEKTDDRFEAHYAHPDMLPPVPGQEYEPPPGA